MRVILAEPMGMCFGVRDALRAAARVPNAHQTTIHGQLVHNPLVLHQLEMQGFRQRDEHDRDALPETAAVLITAHGISGRQRERLTAAGKTLIDTTCPLVTRVHAAAGQLAQAGYHVLVLGQHGHVEVRGIVEDLASFDVVGSVDEVREYSHRRLGIVCQTTLPPRLAEELRLHIQWKNPLAEIRFVDTICAPTRERQQAIEQLVEQVPAVVVVGGRGSNNTRQLVALCQERGASVCHVESAAELDPNWLAPFEVVGLAAGTSTLDETVAQVHETLLKFAPADSVGQTNLAAADLY